MQSLSPIKKLFICILLPFCLVPFQPAGLNSEAYAITLILFGLLLSFFLKPYPMGMMVLLTLLLLTALKLVTLKDALSGFSASVVWLVIGAFMIARVIIDSQLGKRISLILIHKLASSTLGIAYAICLSELCFGPLVASNTARGGGIMSPIVNNLLNALGISPYQDKKRVGEYLILVATHANTITSAMFLTGMAANPLVSAYAKDYLHIDFNWLTWALGAIVPGLCALFLLPLVLFLLLRPKKVDSQKAKENTGIALTKLGKMSSDEKIISLVFLGLIVGWISTPFHGFSATLIAWFGVSALLLTGTLPWKRFSENHQAWDAMMWLGGLITIINLLKSKGVIQYFIDLIDPAWLSSLPSVTALIVLVIFYLYSMYACTMLTAHISAFLGAIFMVCANLHTPPLLTAALFAYFSNLCATLTHYSTGQVVIYYSYRFVKLPTWFGIGFILSLYHLTIWLGLGLPWWKFLGFY